jgi:uncharacterized protein (DUF736 family)
MMEYDNNNRGSLFKNDRKDDAKFPDYKGSINVEGIDYWLSAWIKVSKDGQKFMSLSIKNKNADASLNKKPSKPKQEEFDDLDLPF